jgi:AAA domain-containing protein
VDDAELGLQELLFNRVVADPALPARCKDLLVAAFDSDLQLAATLRGGTAATSPGSARPARPDSLAEIYLRAVRVRGFRGIGPKACLDLRPGPGLTVVTGRNGSGKSSFAEAARVCSASPRSRFVPAQPNQVAPVAVRAPRRQPRQVVGAQGVTCLADFAPHIGEQGFLDLFAGAFPLLIEVQDFDQVRILSG